MPTNGDLKFEEGVTYNCKVDSVIAGESANKGTPLLDFKLIVSEGAMQGEILHYEAYCTEGRKERMATELKILGFDVETHSWDDLYKIVAGKECAVILKNDSWQGKSRMRVDRFKAKGASEAEGGALGRIASLFGGRVSGAAAPIGEGKDERVPF